jgi:GTP-binding protein
MDARFLGSAVKDDQYPKGDSPEIAFAGRSNVGKSSLINCLTNRKNLAKTSSEPGRTRVINFFSVSDQLVLVDLPGYGFARVPLQVKEAWRLMVERYLLGRANLKGVVVITDIRRGIEEADLELLQWLRHHSISALSVLTKADKVSRGEAESRRRQCALALSGLGMEEPLLFSSRTRLGRDELWHRIKDLIARNP